MRCYGPESSLFCVAFTTIAMVSKFLLFCLLLHSSSKASHESKPESNLMKTFKFRAYAPRVFSKIRRMSGIDKDEFAESLCGNSNFIEFMANSQSGEVSYYSERVCKNYHSFF